MGSRGSVIPFFKKQKEIGILPITDEWIPRFNITLEKGVDFVLKCLDQMWSNELFVPKVPSYRILDISKAIAPECIFNIVGIRPGEKLYEEMITDTDALNTLEFDKCYVILPSSVNLGWSKNDFFMNYDSCSGKLCNYGFSYNSGTNIDFLTIDDLKKMIDKYV